MFSKVKYYILVSFLFIAGGLAYFFSVSASAQGKASKMRCTNIELSGAKYYDIVTKKVTRTRRKVILNRCVAEDVICYQSFDQSGLLSCVKR